MELAEDVYNESFKTASNAVNFIGNLTQNLDNQ
jgi:hypothetical protein